MDKDKQLYDINKMPCLAVDTETVTFEVEGIYSDKNVIVTKYRPTESFIQELSDNGWDEGLLRKICDLEEK